MIAVLPLELMKNSRIAGDILGLLGRNISTLLLTYFDEPPNTGAAMVMDLRDVYLKSMQQELNRVKEELQFSFPGLHVVAEPESGLLDQLETYPNTKKILTFLLADLPPLKALEWLSNKGLKGRSAIWLASWTPGRLRWNHGAELHYRSREAKSKDVAADFSQESNAAAAMLEGYNLKPGSLEETGDLALMRWRFNGASPSSLVKMVRQELDERPMVLTHLLPDINH
ncbi:MAG: hypothetical protein ACOVSS_06195 [Bacteroidia bacterium]|jgi:hypothetical protein